MGYRMPVGSHQLFALNLCLRGKISESLIYISFETVHMFKSLIECLFSLPAGGDLKGDCVTNPEAPSQGRPLHFSVL